MVRTTWFVSLLAVVFMFGETVLQDVVELNTHAHQWLASYFGVGCPAHPIFEANPVLVAMW